MPSVLIAEDEPRAALYFKSVVEGLGYYVCGIAETADEAVKLSVENSPDLILMEVQLPGGADGVDAARRIHEASSVPVVYLLDSDDAAASARLKAGAPADILVKPVAPHRIWRALVQTCPPV